MNGNQVFITLLNNLTLTTTLTALNSSTLDTITSVKTSFLQNIAGLTLSYAKITKQPVIQTGPTGISPYGGNSGAGSGFQPYVSRGSSYGAFGGGNGNSVTSTLEPFDGNTYINYVNLNSSPLNQALPGDVYLFDLNGNTLDLYTADVSHLADAKKSVIYYDQYYFSFSSPNLVLNINR